MAEYNKYNEVLSFHVYMWNKWCKEEAQKVFNTSDEPWEYSMGEYIWKMWVRYTERHGSLNAVASMVCELSENYLDKLIQRACEVYDGRNNREK